MNEKIARAGSLIVSITVAVFAVCMLIDFSKGGLIFNYDLLGYGFMALSTFFTGLTIEGRSKADKVLKWLMLIHGIFFIACLIMPITGVLRQTADVDAGKGGVNALECWCAYFIPVGVLSYIHFGDKHRGEN
ncbi:MAG: hypothetical protein MSA09_06615 [Lachnospiraceae bacterium]|nr:hypothetical protein [Lachnospiraceae bacterium]